MGVEVEKTLVLFLQRREQGEQCHVLVHVREIAGVEAVAIFQRRERIPYLREARERHRPDTTGALRVWRAKESSDGARRVLVREPRWPETLQSRVCRPRGPGPGGAVPAWADAQQPRLRGPCRAPGA